MRPPSRTFPVLLLFLISLPVTGRVQGHDLIESFNSREHEIPVKPWIDTMLVGADGVLYLGESSRISHLIRIKDFKYISVIGA